MKILTTIPAAILAAAAGFAAFVQLGFAGHPFLSMAAFAIPFVHALAWLRGSVASRVSGPARKIALLIDKSPRSRIAGLLAIAASYVLGGWLAFGVIGADRPIMAAAAYIILPQAFAALAILPFEKLCFFLIPDRDEDEKIRKILEERENDRIESILENGRAMYRERMAKNGRAE